MSKMPSHIKASLLLTYLVDIVLYAMIVAMLYVPDMLYGDSLLPFTRNNVSLRSFWYYIAASAMLALSVFFRLKQVKRALAESNISFLKLLPFDTIPFILSIPLWFTPQYSSFALMLGALSVIKLLTDAVIFLKNEYSQVFLLMLIMLVFSITNICFVQWGRIRTTKQKAELVFHQCNTSNFWVLPSTDWSVGFYDDGELIRSEGKYHYMPYLDMDKLPTSDYRRNNYQDTEHFSFIDGRRVYVVSCNAWPDAVTLFSNITSLFFIYIAIALLVYWIVFWVRRGSFVQRSFFAHLRISLLFFLLGSLLVIFLLTMGFVAYRYSKNARQGLADVMSLLVDNVKPLLESENSLQPAFSMVENLSDLYHTEVSLYNENGKLEYTTDTLHVVYNITSWTDNPFETMRSAVEARVVFDFNNTMKVKAYGIITSHNAPTLYAVMWSESDMERIRNEMSFFLVMLLVLYFVLVTLAVVFSYIVSRLLAKPLREIDKRMSAITLGAKNKKIDYIPNEKDELSHLIRNYNQMVDKLDESAAELALIERENSWRDMSRQIAHEIKNPLTPMRLILQQMMMNNSNDIEQFRDKIKSQASILLVQVDTLYATACSLSDFARQPLQHPIPVNMSEKAHHVAELFRNNDSGVLLDVVAEADDLYVFIDKNVSLRLFTNLVRNAIQAIPDDRQGRVEIHIAAQNDNVVVRIIDNGSGIPESALTQIFNANFTTKTKGMGLGLCVVKNAVEAAGGSISVDSTVGVGTTFTVVWPRYKFDKE